jgi:hypothetical protein
VSDPTRDFTDVEWDCIGPVGRAFVSRERQRINGRGRGGFRGARAGRNNGGARGRVINEVVIPAGGGTNVAESVTMASRGGRSGAGFGRGAYFQRGGQQS